MARILIVSKYYHPFRGGVEDNTRAVAEHLARRHDVTAIAFHHERQGVTTIEKIGNVTVKRFRTPRVVKSQPISRAYIAAILREPADLIYFHAPNVLGSAAILARLARDRGRTRLVTMHHMDIFGRPILRVAARWLYDRILHRSDRLIVTSLKNATVSADIRVKIDPDAIPLGITPAHFAMTNDQRADAIAWRKSLCGNAPVIAFVGRHARYKGLDVLIRALARLPDGHGLIAGDGPFRAATEALATKLGIADRVHFLGGVSHEDKLRLLAAADIFAFPSTEITEAFGVSQLEAMLVGTPVVATDLPTGVTDVAVDDVSALLAKPGDVDTLADAISRLIAEPALAKRLSETARTRVLEHFTVAQMTERNSTLIEQLLRAGPQDEQALASPGGRQPLRGKEETINSSARRLGTLTAEG